MRTTKDTPSLFNGVGAEMPNHWVHVPDAYTRKILPKDKQLAIIEISKRKVVVALRSGRGYTIGMMKHLPLFKDRLKREYFNYKGKKILLQDCNAVF
jgi:hypothetical protein